jgi:2Fe-2S ferredoxin
MTVIHLIVKDRDGKESNLELPLGQTLMQALRDADLGVLGTCGGLCSCGSCHVFLSETLAAKLPQPSEDEQYMLEALADAIEVRATSRLSCQIKADDVMDGAVIEIGPEL